MYSSCLSIHSLKKLWLSTLNAIFAIWSGSRWQFNFAWFLIIALASDSWRSASTTFTAKLMRTLDFTDRSSYKNPDSRTYKDVNEDGIIDTLYVELTKLVVEFTYNYII